VCVCVRGTPGRMEVGEPIWTVGTPSSALSERYQTRQGPFQRVGRGTSVWMCEWASWEGERQSVCVCVLHIQVRRSPHLDGWPRHRAERLAGTRLVCVAKICGEKQVMP
jgi:hypothetical protein